MTEGIHSSNRGDAAEQMWRAVMENACAHHARMPARFRLREPGYDPNEHEAGFVLIRYCATATDDHCNCPNPFATGCRIPGCLGWMCLCCGAGCDLLMGGDHADAGGWPDGAGLL